MLTLRPKLSLMETANTNLKRMQMLILILHQHKCNRNLLQKNNANDDSDTNAVLTIV